MRVPLLPLLVAVPFLCHGTEKISSKRLFVFGKGSGAHDWVRRIKIQIPVEFTLRELESRIQSRSEAWNGASLALCAEDEDGRITAIAEFSKHWIVDSRKIAAYITPQGGEKDYESCIRALKDYIRAGAPSSTPADTAPTRMRGYPEGQAPPGTKGKIEGTDAGVDVETVILRGRKGHEIKVNVAPAVKSDGLEETSEETSRRVCQENAISGRMCLQLFQGLQSRRPMPASTVLSSPRPKIYDGFIISTELDLLEAGHSLLTLPAPRRNPPPAEPIPSHRSAFTS